MTLNLPDLSMKWRHNPEEMKLTSNLK